MRDDDTNAGASSHAIAGSEGKILVAPSEDRNDTECDDEAKRGKSLTLRVTASKDSDNIEVTRENEIEGKIARGDDNDDASEWRRRDPITNYAHGDDANDRRGESSRLGVGVGIGCGNGFGDAGDGAGNETETRCKETRENDSNVDSGKKGRVEVNL